MNQKRPRTYGPIRRALRLEVWSFVLFSSFELCPASFAATPRNILLIIADDYGVDSSSLYNSTANGASLPPTPNLAALATNGVVFRNAYANPVCSPTRAALITGQHAFRTGIGNVIEMGTPALTAAQFTLPDAFAANPASGHALAQFGKWHLANGRTAPGAIGGWPHFAGSLIGAIPNYTNWTKTVNGVQSSNQTNYATTDVVNDAVAWIQARGAQPWFAWVAFNAPHTPFHVPPAAVAPGYATNNSGITPNRRQFEAMVEAMDTEIGRLLAAVDRANTHIIFLGDNGTLGSVIQPPFVSTRGKDTLYEGGIHVPLIISGPAVVNPNRTNDTLVNMVDVFATILELAGTSVVAVVPTNVTVDGQSLLAALQTTNTLSRYAYSELFGTNVAASVGGRALRNSQFKLIRFNSGGDEFYDLLADPDESVNLLASSLTAAQQANYYSLVMKLGDYQTALAPPVITGFTRSNGQFLITVQRNLTNSYGLWCASALDGLNWSPRTNVLVTTNGAASVTLTDTNASASQSFYRVSAQ